MCDRRRFNFLRIWEWTHTWPWAVVVLSLNSAAPFQDVETANRFVSDVMLGGFAGAFVGLAIGSFLFGPAPCVQSDSLAGRGIGVGCCIGSLLFLARIDFPILTVFLCIPVFSIVAALVGTFRQWKKIQNR